jgi:hypothetical protein
VRTDAKLGEICDRLHINCGDIHEAARWCGVSPAFVFSWIKDDKVAAETVREAQRVGYAGLESEAIRRAVVGTSKDVYYKGEVVGQQIEYSDGLLSKVMEARLPEYKKGDGGNTLVNFGNMQINSMPRAANYDEWLAMRDTTLARRDAENALPAPDNVVDAEFTVIPELQRPLAALEALFK